MGLNRLKTGMESKLSKDGMMLRFKRMEGNDLPLPSYKTPGSAGMDIRAFLPGGAVTLKPGARMRVPTGLSVELPAGTEMQIRPRSGIAATHGVTVLNSPATIDSDFRGLVDVLLVHHGDAPFEINHGDRIAQIVIAPVLQLPVEEAEDLSETVRGTGGFGSTGLS